MSERKAQLNTLYLPPELKVDSMEKFHKCSIYLARTAHGSANTVCYVAEHDHFLNTSLVSRIETAHRTNLASGSGFAEHWSIIKNG